MTAYHLNINVTTTEPDVIDQLTMAGGLLEDLPNRLSKFPGVEASGCHFHIVDDEPQEPSTRNRVDALIDYLGVDVALEALEEALPVMISADAKTADREAGERVIRAANGDVVRRVPLLGEIPPG